MHFTIEREKMLGAMTRIQRVVERKNTIPILGNVVLTAEGGSITLRATDLELEVSETVAAKIVTKGTTSVPAHMTFEILRKLPVGSEISFKVSENVLTAQCGRSRFRLNTLPAEDHPTLDVGEMAVSFSLLAADIASLARRTQSAISTEETRFFLNGIYLHVVSQGKDKFLRAIATDGHRLAQTQIPCPQAAEHMPGVIVPRKTVGELQKLVDGRDDEIEIELSTQKIRMTAGGAMLTSKLIEGLFPDYARVIPVNNDKVMTVDKADFEHAIDRVATVASDRSGAVKLSLSSGKVVMTVNNPDSGAATEELEAEYTGDALDVRFNSRYLLKITSELQGERAVLKFNDPGSPALIRAHGCDHSLFVLMPMRA